jgi:hypothetical protein
MGQLTRFDLEELVGAFGIKNYLETGTGLGVSLEYALKSKNIKNFFSIEIDKNLANSPQLHQKISAAKSEDQSLKVINSDSLSALRTILDGALDDAPTLFFLDAHFPGADFFQLSYADSVDQNSVYSLPVILELAAISLARNVAKKDVIIIDDLFLFDSGEFEFDRLHPDKAESVRKVLRQRDMYLGGSFITVLKLIFGPNRKFRRFYEHQGYIIILPE